MTLPEVHLVAGGLSDAVKLAPVATALRAAGMLRPVMVTCGRHPAGVRHMLAAFGLESESTMSYPADDLAARAGWLDDLWGVRMPAAVLVAGDTTTALAAAMAANWRHVPVVHVDAGRRSAQLDAVEADRHLLAQLSSMHLVTTAYAAMNLLDERVEASDILITGSTAVDAAVALANRALPYASPAVARAACAGHRLILLTTREPRTERLAQIICATRRLVEAHPDVEVVASGHPAVRDPLTATLGGLDRVTIAEPLPHQDLARLLRDAYLVLTDPDGVEEVAPSFGVPALVIDGAASSAIVREASRLLVSRLHRDSMTAGGNPYGDGLAAKRAGQATAAVLGLADRPEPMPGPIRPHRSAVS